MIDGPLNNIIKVIKLNFKKKKKKNRNSKIFQIHLDLIIIYKLDKSRRWNINENREEKRCFFTESNI